MIKTRTLVGVGIGLFVSTQTLQSQDRSRYREFQLGSGLPAVTALTGVAASEVKSIHQRPAVIQELQWRPRYAIRVAAAAHTDAVQQITFSFYNDQLFKVVVDYDHDRTAGMTDADMIRKA